MTEYEKSELWKQAPLKIIIEEAKFKKLKSLYARLAGIKSRFPEDSYVRFEIVNDFNN